MGARDEVSEGVGLRARGVMGDIAGVWKAKMAGIALGRGGGR